jgi:hypothetical protein
LLHNRPRKQEAATPVFFAEFRFTGPGSLAMIEAQNQPATKSKKGDGNVESKGIMDEDGRAGRRSGVRFGRGGTNHTSTGTGRERGTDGRQRRDADRVPETRPVAALERAQRAAPAPKAFPPEGVEVVSWYVMMGVGQVVTLRLPASRLREVNRILENTAWGSYRTEFYPTYDYKAIGIAAHEKAQ